MGDEMNRRYWQVAAGSRGRDYSDLFLKYGLAFVGGDTKVAAMREVRAGDVMVLKAGLSRILAAGEVVERNGRHSGCDDKVWLRDFDGWDLRAWCHVDWRRAPSAIETTGLTRATIQIVHQASHQAIADELLLLPPLEIEREPDSTEKVSDERILEFLVGEGLRPAAAEELTNTFRRVRLLAEYYYEKCEWDEIREHETRTFLIVPLLLALGWSEQQMKIELPTEGGRVDLACFSRAQHHNDADCVMVVESKDFGSGLDYAPEQARRYASSFPSCRVILVSNGYCYKAFLRDSSGTFSKTATAYLNVRDPRDRYPLDPRNVAGALEALRWLLPATVR